MHNFISGYAIVQHQPNYIHTHKHTKNHKQFLKMKKNPPTLNCQSDTGMKLK